MRQCKHCRLDYEDFFFMDDEVKACILCQIEEDRRLIAFAERRIQDRGSLLQHRIDKYKWRKAVEEVTNA